MMPDDLNDGEWKGWISDIRVTKGPRSPSPELEEPKNTPIHHIITGILALCALVGLAVWCFR